MAFQILKDMSAVEHIRNCAVVESQRRTGLKGLFGPKVGSVSISTSQGADRPLLRVTIPKWKGGRGQEWLLLKQCYLTVLEEAEQQGCKTIVIPLLAAGDPAFPASIDYKIAVETIREFQISRYARPLQNIYLLVLRKNTVQRRDIEHYLHRSEPKQQAGGGISHMDLHLDFDSLPLCPMQEPEPIQAEQAPVYPGAALNDACAAPIFDDDWEDFPEEELAEEESWEEESWEEESQEEESQEEELWEEESRAAPKARRAAKRALLPLPSRPRPNLAELEKRLKVKEAGFSETLLKLIDRSGKKDSEIYNKANVSRQHFSKIRNNTHYKPTKQTAIAFAIALELDMEQTKDLIGRAGYALTTSSQFDLIIMYFIEEGIYDMFDINETLYEFDQTLLGA